MRITIPKSKSGLPTWNISANKRVIQLLLTIVILTISVFLSTNFLPPGIDWSQTYRPATLALLHGQSPFTVDIYFAAPWALISLIPFALLPENIGRGALFILGLIAFLYSVVRLGGKKLSIIAYLLSPSVIHCLLNSNIEWLPILGFVLPPQIGLFFVSIKPQIGIGVAIYWFVEAWNKGGVRQIIRVFGPFSGVLILSFLIYGFWPLRFRETLLLTQGYNASIWPIGIPLALVLLVQAVRTRKSEPAMAAGPFISPYALLHAYAGALIALAKSETMMIAASVGLWMTVLIRAFR